VRHLALSISGFLIGQGAQMVVFACNTSSAYALQIARHKFQVPLAGMIEPGARAAVAANGQSNAPIGVLATQATVNSRMYSRWIEGLRPDTKCIEMGCPEFVPLVESEQADSAEARAACRKYLRPLLEAGVKTVVLGCTHYPLLLPVLNEAVREMSDFPVAFVDPAQAVAQEVQTRFERVAGEATAKDTFFVSGPRDGVRGWVEKLLGDSDPQIVEGPVFTPPSDIGSIEERTTVSVTA
jgi:glutamate racemase